MPVELTLRIVLENPPADYEYALQKGSGSSYESVQKQFSNGSDLMFEFQPVLRQAASGAVLAGPFVQGPPKQRFVYIGIGTYACGARSPWSGRLKVPLEGITPEAAQSGGILEARVPGTGRNGLPNCATVKGFGGWQRVHGVAAQDR